MNTLRTYALYLYIYIGKNDKTHAKAYINLPAKKKKKLKYAYYPCVQICLFTILTIGHLAGVSFEETNLS